MSNPCAACGYFWRSQADAARHLGINRTNVNRLLREGRFEVYVRRKLGLKQVDVVPPVEVPEPPILQAIDDLIRDQEALLERLRERRKAITEADRSERRA